MMFRIMMMTKLMREAVMDVAKCGVRYFWIGSVPFSLGRISLDRVKNTDTLYTMIPMTEAMISRI